MFTGISDMLNQFLGMGGAAQSSAPMASHGSLAGLFGNKAAMTPGGAVGAMGAQMGQQGSLGALAGQFAASQPAQMLGQQATAGAQLNPMMMAALGQLLSAQNQQPRMSAPSPAGGRGGAANLTNLGVTNMNAQQPGGYDRMLARSLAMSRMGMGRG